MARIDEIAGGIKAKKTIEKIGGAKEKAKESVGVDPEQFIKSADEFLASQAPALKYFEEIKAKEVGLRRKLEDFMSSEDVKAVLSEKGINNVEDLLKNPDAFGEPIDEIAELEDTRRRVMELAGYLDEPKNAQAREKIEETIPKKDFARDEIWEGHMISKANEYDDALDEIEKRFSVLAPENREKLEACLAEVDALIRNGIIVPQGWVEDFKDESKFTHSRRYISKLFSGKKVDTDKVIEFVYEMAERNGLDNLSVALGMAIDEATAKQEKGKPQELFEGGSIVVARSMMLVVFREKSKKLCSELGNMQLYEENRAKTETTLANTIEKIRQDYRGLLQKKITIDRYGQINFDDDTIKEMIGSVEESTYKIAGLKEKLAVENSRGFLGKIFGSEKNARLLQDSIDEESGTLEYYEGQLKKVREGISIQDMLSEAKTLVIQGMKDIVRPDDIGQALVRWSRSETLGELLNWMEQNFKAMDSVELTEEQKKQLDFAREVRHRSHSL